jgi:hypothetical protein
LKDGGATIAYWRSDPNGKPCHGGRSQEVARAGLLQEIAGPLEICSARALHATLDPMKWDGARLWIVALLGEVQRQEDKLGALRREIVGEVVL